MTEIVGRRWPAIQEALSVLVECLVSDEASIANLDEWAMESRPPARRPRTTVAELNVRAPGHHQDCGRGQDQPDGRPNGANRDAFGLGGRWPVTVRTVR